MRFGNFGITVPGKDIQAGMNLIFLKYTKWKPLNQNQLILISSGKNKAPKMQVLKKHYHPPVKSDIPVCSARNRSGFSLIHLSTHTKKITNHVQKNVQICNSGRII
jgi:hypothetical protein